MNWQDRIYENLTEAKTATEHSMDVFHKKLGNAGAGETKRSDAAIKASDEAKKTRDRRLKQVTFLKGQKIFKHSRASKRTRGVGSHQKRRTS